MSLELRNNSKWWYGAFTINGKRQIVNLGVLIEGRRPKKRTMIGDDIFERSRGRAFAEYDRRVKEFEEERTTERALRKLVEFKTGRRVVFPLLAELPDLWLKINRRRQPSPTYSAACQRILRQFAAFVAEAQPDATEFVCVTPETAKAFLDSETARGVSPTTWNYALKCLRTTFRRLHPQLTDSSNPFRPLITKESETVGRQPFTVEELRTVVEVSARDPFTRPLIITGMCTAMRRGDCCQLKWSDVDLKEGFISVKTAKTGEKVDIPIFPMLAEELVKARKPAGTSPFCFPDQARMYQNNPDGITWRVKRLLARALEFEEVRAGRMSPELSAEDVRTRGHAYIDSLGINPKAPRMRAVLDAYAAGDNIDIVMTKTGCGRGTISSYLNEIQAHLGGRFIRGKSEGNLMGLLQTSRPNGLRKASIRDFHSFRVTWITLALAAGVPLELVQRVTGHRTVGVVLRHYFRPGREDFRKTLLQAMPSLLGETAHGNQESGTKITEAVGPALFHGRESMEGCVGQC